MEYDIMVQSWTHLYSIFIHECGVSFEFREDIVDLRNVAKVVNRTVLQHFSAHEG